MRRKNSPGCTCCQEACPPSYADDFSDDLSDWTTDSGTWSIGSGKLTCTAAGTIRNSYSDSDGIYVTRAEIDLKSVGDKVRLIAARQDASNYVYAQIERTGSTSAEIKTYRVQSGTHTQVAVDSHTVLTWDRVVAQLCWNGSSKIIGAQYWMRGNPAVAAHCPRTAITGTYGSGHGIQVDTVGSSIDVEWYRVYDQTTESNPECPSCLGSCDECDDFQTAGLYKVVIKNHTVGNGTYFVTLNVSGCRGSLSIPGVGTLYLGLNGLADFASSSRVCVRLSAGLSNYYWSHLYAGGGNNHCAEWDALVLDPTNSCGTGPPVGTTPTGSTVEITALGA